MPEKEDQDPKPQKDEIPDPNIKPPPYDIVTEGFDPSDIERKDKK